MVLFPGFSAVRSDPARVRRVYLSVTRLAAVVLLPVCAGMAVAGREIVLVGLGDQWLDAIPLVPFFALAAALAIMSKLDLLLAEACNALNRALGLQLGYLVVLAVLMAGAGWLMEDVWIFAAALAVGEVMRHIAYTVLMRRVTGAGIAEVLRALVPAVFAAVVVAATIALVRWPLADFVGAPWLLLVEMAAGLVGLVVGIRLSPFPAVRQDLRQRLHAAGLLGPRRPRATKVGGLLLGRSFTNAAPDVGGVA
jgi:O-antigen/teichoic acid export membrane protein